jgi:hypothetical protein
VDFAFELLKIVRLGRFGVKISMKNIYIVDLKYTSMLKTSYLDFFFLVDCCSMLEGVGNNSFKIFFLAHFS